MMWLYVVAAKSELMMFSGFHLYRIYRFVVRCPNGSLCIDEQMLVLSLGTRIFLIYTRKPRMQLLSVPTIVCYWSSANKWAMGFRLSRYHIFIHTWRGPWTPLTGLTLSGLEGKGPKLFFFFQSAYSSTKSRRPETCYDQMSTTTA